LNEVLQVRFFITKQETEIDILGMLFLWINY